MRTPRVPKTLVKRLMFLPPLAIGVLIAYLLVQSRQKPARRPPEEAARPVRTITLRPIDLVPRTLGFGEARPGRVWRAVAKVAGEVIETHPRLDNGAFLKKDTELLKIDSTRYELALREAEAAIEEIDAQLAELEESARNTEAMLEIESRSLELARQKLVRTEGLLETEVASQNQVDEEERAVLQQRSIVRNLQSEQSLIPAKRNALVAKRAVQESKLERSRLDVADAVLVAPFDCRLANVEIEVGQYVAVGERLFEADSLAKSTVTAQVQVRHMSNLMRNQEARQRMTEGEFDLPKLLELTATVRLRYPELVVEWPAVFTGIEGTIDSQTRTAGVVVDVEQSYERAEPGRKPPLVKGMYVEVELRGPVMPRRLVVPRSALRNGNLWVVDGDRLRFAPVEIDFQQMDFAVVKSGLSSGDQIVVSDLIPALPGMLLAPTPDHALRERLEAQASGERAIQ